MGYDASNPVPEAGLKSGAVTAAKIADGALVNANVNAAAAIAGTKIDPTFGEQTVSTGVAKGRAGCTSVAFSIVGTTPTAIATIAPPADGIIRVNVGVELVKSDGTDAWGADVSRRFRVTGGVVTALAAASVASEGTPAFTLDIDTSGGNLRVMLTAPAGTWRGVCEYGSTTRTTEA